MNFEESVHSNGKSREFINWHDYFTKYPSKARAVEHDYFSKYPAAKAKFLNSFKTNFPDLCWKRNIVVIDCTAFTDPDHDLRLRSHPAPTRRLSIR